MVVQYGEGNRIIDLYIFIMFMLSSFRDLLQVSGFIDNPVSFTILNHHLVGNILLQVMLSTNYIKIWKGHQWQRKVNVSDNFHDSL
jgi:hypothetical protein